MKYEIRECVLEDIREIKSWKHEGEYSFYNISDKIELEKVLEEDSFVKYFAVTKDQKLAGHFCYWFDAEKKMMIGLGLKPELTGKGLGEAFVNCGIEFGREKYQYNGNIKLAVAKFNKRAIKVYERVGFKEVGETVLGIEEPKEVAIFMELEGDK